MPNLIQTIKKSFSKKEPLVPGLYTYHTDPGEADQHRLHLRIEEDGTGVLVVDASTILHLNQTAAEFAYHMINQTDDSEVVEKISHRYRVDKDQARQDFEDFREQLRTLIDTPDLDPVTYLGMDRQEPYSGKLSAPYRLDCALTYRVMPGSRMEDAPVDRVDKELTKDEWLAILQKAYAAGIPHLLFTGGEPTLREDLPDLLQFAEDMGLVTGVLTNALKFADDAYRSTILDCGLDHIMMVFDPDDPREWETLEKILAEDLHTTVHLTLRKGIDLTPVIRKLAELGAHALSLSEADRDLTEELQALRDLAAVEQLELVWDMPVPYSSNNPVSLELENGEGQDAPEGAGKAWLYVEPDGDVLPAQGMYDQVLGNLLTDEWEEIWSAE